MLSLKRLKSQDADELFALIQKNRVHLGSWFPWVNVTEKVEDTLKFIEQSCLLTKAQKGVYFKMVSNHKIIGIVGATEVVYPKVRMFDLNYWIDAGYQGKGITSNAIKGLVGALYNKWNSKAFRIKLDKRNLKSIKLAERLGFNLCQNALSLQESETKSSTLYYIKYFNDEPIFEA